jgi:hypothetical protein
MQNYSSSNTALSTPGPDGSGTGAADAWSSSNAKLGAIWSQILAGDPFRLGYKPADKGHGNQRRALQEEVDRIVAGERPGAHPISVMVSAKDAAWRESAASLNVKGADKPPAYRLRSAAQKPSAGKESGSAAQRPMYSVNQPDVISSRPYMPADRQGKGPAHWPGPASLRPDYGYEVQEAAHRPVSDGQDSAAKNWHGAGLVPEYSSKVKEAAHRPIVVSDVEDSGATNGHRAKVQMAKPLIVSDGNDSLSTNWHGAKVQAAVLKPVTTPEGLRSAAADGPVVASLLPEPEDKAQAAAHKPVIGSDGQDCSTTAVRERPSAVAAWEGPRRLAPGYKAKVPAAALKPVIVSDATKQRKPDAADSGGTRTTSERPEAKARQLPRLVMYHQTIHHDGALVPIRDLVDLPTGLTHLYVAAWHVNGARNVTLNNLPATHTVNDDFWRDIRAIQRKGVKVLAMLGGAARGSYEQLKLRGDDYLKHYHPMLERYLPLMVLLKHYEFDGIDLDVEEHMTLDDVQRLINRVRADFGRDFLITLAPVYPAMLSAPGATSPAKRRGAPVDAAAERPQEQQQHSSPLCAARGAAVAATGPGRRRNLSGFSYFELEASPEGRQVAWYNVQLYCGWGDAGDPAAYDAMVKRGWDPRRLVLGTVASAEHGAGYVRPEVLARTLRRHVDVYGDAFGGLMGWEYWRAGHDLGWAPWRWVATMGQAMKRIKPRGLWAADALEMGPEKMAR